MVINRFPVCVLAVVIAALPVAVGADEETQRQDILAREDLQLAGEPAPIRKTKEAPDAAGTVMDFFYYVAMSKLSRGQHEQAIEWFEKVLKVNPGHHRAQFNLGNAFYEQGKYARAIEAYERAIELTSNMTLDELMAAEVYKYLYNCSVANNYITEFA